MRAQCVERRLPRLAQRIVRARQQHGDRSGVRHCRDAGFVRVFEVVRRKRAEFGGEGPTAYEVLLDAALRGVPGHFARQDAVEETWRVVQPLLDSPPPVETYEPGTWGPPAADDLVSEYGGWRSPWLPQDAD